MKGEKEEKKVSWAKEKGKSEEERKRGTSNAQSTLQPRVFGRPRRVCGQVTVVTEHYGTSLWWVGCGERARGSIWLFLFVSHSFPVYVFTKRSFFVWGCFQRKSNIQNFGITIHPSFSACASEGGDSTPHGSEGGTVQCGPVSDSEWSTSRRQGQGRASLSISNDYLVFICAWALELLNVSTSVCLYAYVMCLCTCLITEKLQSWVKIIQKNFLSA